MSSDTGLARRIEIVRPPSVPSRSSTCTRIAATSLSGLGPFFEAESEAQPAIHTEATSRQAGKKVLMRTVQPRILSADIADIW